MNKHAVAAVAVSLMALSGCAEKQPTAAPTTSATPVEIDYGQQYLDAVCPETRFFDTMYQHPWFAQDSISYGTAVPSDVSRLYKKLAKKQRRSAKALVHGSWPDDVQPYIEKVAAEQYEAVLVSQERAKSKTFEADWSKYEDTSNAASKVRLLLDLPPRGKGCTKN